MTDPSSTEVPAGDPNAPEATLESPTPSETAPSPEPPRGLKGSGLRYSETDGVPSWAVGKTADEILSTASDLYTTLQKTSTQPPTTTVPSAPTPPQQTPAVDPNLMYSDPAEYTRQLQESIRSEMRQEMQSAAGSLLTPMASLARAEAMRNPQRKLVWDRYGPEIETMVNNLGPQASSNPEIWDQAAKIVAGSHLDELAALKAKEMIANSSDSGMLPTEGGIPAQPHATDRGPLQSLFDKKDPSVKGFLEDGISVGQVRSHYAKMGYDTEEKIVELLSGSVVRK